MPKVREGIEAVGTSGMSRTLDGTDCSKNEVHEDHRLVEKRNRQKVHHVSEKNRSECPCEKAILASHRIVLPKNAAHTSKRSQKHHDEDKYERQAAHHTHRKDVICNVRVRVTGIDTRRHPRPSVVRPSQPPFVQMLDR